MTNAAAIDRMVESPVAPARLPAFRGQVELAESFAPRPGISHVLFDFDGTLSLIRQGWPDVMVPMFVEMLPRLPAETEDDLRRLAFEDIMRLNGKQTIYQMIQLAQRIRERGGEPRDPLWYKHEYLRRLEERIRDRITGLESGAIAPDDLLVYGARPLLEHLQRRGLELYLASGTDEAYVKREAALLDIDRYFGPHIYGALDDYQQYSKQKVIERILSENGIAGDQLLALGDGYVEIENTKGARGLAIAVASDEAHNGSGRMDAWKRQRLLGVGADAVIPDFRDAIALVDYVLGLRSCTPHLDLGRLRVLPLAKRTSLSRVDQILIDPDDPPPALPESVAAHVQDCAQRIIEARACGASVMLIYGAHLLRNGAALILERMMRQRWITHLATNGAGSIHDWEFAWFGASTESVRTNVAQGTFGTWHETATYLHLALMAGALRGLGYGQSLGRFILEDGATLPSPEWLVRAIREQPDHPLTPARADLLHAMRHQAWPAGRVHLEHPYKHASIIAQAYRHGIPLSVHPGIGYDIISNHPVFNGAALGRAAELDFKLFGASVSGLDGGVVMSIGSAIMGPQVFEKSLSCVNNLRLQSGQPVVRDHTIYVVDLQDGGGWDWSRGEPPKNNPAYYLRFCKSFARMGGAMRYLQCDNAAFVHNLVCHCFRLAKT